MNLHVVIALGVAAQIHIQVTHAHMHFDSLQVHGTQLHIGVSGAQMGHHIQRNAIIKAQSPLVMRVGTRAVRTWLLDGETSAEAAVLIAHNGLLCGIIERKIRVQQPGRSAFDVQFARAHAHFDAHHLGFVEFHGLGIVLERSGELVSARGVAAVEGQDRQPRKQ